MNLIEKIAANHFEKTGSIKKWEFLDYQITCGMYIEFH